MQRSAPPLAERLRPSELEDIVGQQHLTGPSGVFRKLLDTGALPSMILWGPPGVGKTTIAHVLSQKSGLPIFSLSAISSGVKEVREVIAKAKEAGKAVLFIDEIHRFNKSQQDSLLGAVEQGIIVLIGATTENPSFEVIQPLLSRCQVYILNPLDKDDLIHLVNTAITKDEILSAKNISVVEIDALLALSGGDARKLLNILELAVNSATSDDIVITNDKVQEVVQKRMAFYDKGGEQHYDVISAFIKSMRGSDPNAAVYWLARMIEGGEDPKFIARRMVILASEDIGNANPNALVLATNCFQAVDVIGYPECRIILSQTAAYLACSPKSNASYMAIEEAIARVRQTGDLPVPLHLRNAPTKLMKQLNYGRDYQYAHSYDLNFIDLEYLPESLSGTVFFEPGRNAREEEMRKFLKARWKEKYGY
jgi:putative ATPase